jgi:hypothetical protein
VAAKERGAQLKRRGTTTGEQPRRELVTVKRVVTRQEGEERGRDQMHPTTNERCHTNKALAQGSRASSIKRKVPSRRPHPNNKRKSTKEAPPNKRPN